MTLEELSQRERCAVIQMRRSPEELAADAAAERASWLAALPPAERLALETFERLAPAEQAAWCLDRLARQTAARLALPATRAALALAKAAMAGATATATAAAEETART